MTCMACVQGRSCAGHVTCMARVQGRSCDLYGMCPGERDHVLVM